MGKALEMEQVAGVVAVDQMDRQPDVEDGVQRRRRDQVAAVQHGLGSKGLCFGGGGGEGLAMIVAVGNDADFHPEPRGVLYPQPRQVIFMPA
jgi:hypothetical protein